MPPQAGAGTVVLGPAASATVPHRGILMSTAVGNKITHKATKPKFQKTT